MERSDQGAFETTYMIQVFHVDKVYPGNIWALRDVTFRIKRGEFVFLTGPSGAGKTTLLKLLICAERPTRGQILVDQRNIGRIPRSKIPFLRRRIGFVFQDFMLLDDVSVFENVAFALRAVGKDEDEVAKRVRRALKRVHLEKRVNARPVELSGGERQRVAIARAIANDPALLLADEPTGNLDPEMALDIMNLFLFINSLGTTVLVATHDPALVQRYQKRVMVLERGHLIDDGEDPGGCSGAGGFIQSERPSRGQRKAHSYTS